MAKKENQIPLSVLDPREKLQADRLSADLKDAMLRTQACGYYERMLVNMKTRYCYWPDQSADGRKWPKEHQRRMKPGESPEVFPWPGASDARVRKVDEIIKERVGFQMAAYDRAETRIGPRDLKTEEEGVNIAAVWAMVADYYQDEGKRGFRRQARRWIDLKETYGHAVMFTGWRTQQQLDKKSISAEELMQIVAQGAVEEAEAAARAALAGQEVEPPPPEQSMLDEATTMQVMQTAMATLEEQIMDPEQRQQLAVRLRAFDGEMTDKESLRVAAALKRGEPVTYYVPVVRESAPVHRALLTGVDVLFPPETATLKEAQWIAMPEWMSDVTLRERVVTMGYKQAAVSAALERGPGMCLRLDGSTGWNTELGWVMSGGSVGQQLAASVSDKEKGRMFQVMHVFYRASSNSGIPALYHTILLGEGEAAELFHECCEDAHGEYPFTEAMTQPERDCILDSEGVGEISFSYQQEIKIQRDMRVDFASITIQPPSLVPMNHAGGQMNFRPRAQIPVRMTGGQGKPEFVRMPGDARGSQEVDKTTAESLNELWFRGPTTDPTVRQTTVQNLVNDFLSDLEEVRKMTWKLIQQNASESVKAGAVGGLPVNLDTTREAIQGGVSLRMFFDAGDLDFEMVGKKAELFQKVVAPLDRTGNLPTDEILRVVLGAIVPSWSRILIRDPGKVAADEAKDEQAALMQMMLGIEPPYIPGKDHALRLRVLESALMTPDAVTGGPSKAAQLAQTDPSFQKLLQNRIQFHRFQIAQQSENPAIGRLGVQPIQSQQPTA